MASTPNRNAQSSAGTVYTKPSNPGPSQPGNRTGTNVSGVVFTAAAAVGRRIPGSWFNQLAEPRRDFYTQAAWEERHPESRQARLQREEAIRERMREEGEIALEQKRLEEEALRKQYGPKG